MCVYKHVWEIKKNKLVIHLYSFKEFAQTLYLRLKILILTRVTRRTTITFCLQGIL